MKIFCVEDDDNIREMIEYALKSQGFETAGFENASDFFNHIDEKPDLILMDIMLPDRDGTEILRDIKSSKHSNIPVIFLTAKTSEIDKVRGLDMGADDYITKPFGVMELISRIKAVLRRVEKKNSLQSGTVTVDEESRTVTANGKSVSLTYKEFELLCHLLKNKGVVISREKLLSSVWGYDFDGGTRTVDVHIRTLRQKLGDASDIIETVRNVGYKVVS